jgi:hypothetical protein
MTFLTFSGLSDEPMLDSMSHPEPQVHPTSLPGCPDEPFQCKNEGHKVPVHSSAADKKVIPAVFIASFSVVFSWPIKCKK